MKIDLTGRHAIVTGPPPASAVPPPRGSHGRAPRSSSAVAAVSESNRPSGRYGMPFPAAM